MSIVQHGSRVGKPPGEVKQQTVGPIKPLQEFIERTKEVKFLQTVKQEGKKEAVDCVVI